MITHKFDSMNVEVNIGIKVFEKLALGNSYVVGVEWTIMVYLKNSC